MRAALSAPGMSALLTAKTSPISINPAFDACTPSPRPGTVTTTVQSAVLMDLDVRLSGADGFDNDPPELEQAQHGDEIGRGLAQAPDMAARGQAAEIGVGIAGASRPPDAVAKHGAAGVRAGRIDGEDGDALAGLRPMRRQRIDQSGLAGARRAGDADHIGPARQPIGLRENILVAFRLILDRADGAGNAPQLCRLHEPVPHFGECVLDDAKLMGGRTGIDRHGTKQARAACAMSALGLAPSRPGSGMLGLFDDIVDDLGDRRAGKKDLVDPARVQFRDVLLRNDAARQNTDVVGAALVEQRCATWAATPGARPREC